MPLANLSLQFASDFVWLGVAIGGLTLVVLGRGMTATVAWGRGCLVVGFAAMGVAAFILGVFDIARPVSDPVMALRLLAVVALAAGGWRWPLGRTRIALYLFGLLCILAGSLDPNLPGGSDVGAACILAGGLALTAVLLGACRNSVVARVVASAAVALLLVVVVLSAPMTDVLSASTSNGEQSALASQARLISIGVGNFVNKAIAFDRYGAADLEATMAAAGARDPLLLAGELHPPGGAAAATQVAARDQIRAELATIGGLYAGEVWVYVPAGGAALAAPGTPPALAAGLGSLRLATKERCPTAADRNNGGLAVIDHKVLAVGTFPECLATAKAPAPGAGETYAAGGKLGVLVQAEVLTSKYLTSAVGKHLSLSFFGAQGFLATSGRQPSYRSLVGLSRSDGSRASATLDNRYVALEPVLAITGQRMEIAASLPVAATNPSVVRLFRALFLIAFGGTILAFWLTLATSDRITAGLRRLTIVSRRIQSGQTRERVRLEATDEVGALAGAFDSMLDAIDRQQTALGEAAAGEARLRDRLEAVVAGMGDALVAVDARGHITDFNRAAERLLNVPAVEAVGKPLDDVVRLTSVSGAPFNAAQAALYRPRQPVQARLPRSDGTDVPVAVSAGTLGGAVDRPDGTVLVLRDLRGEQELERMKSELLSRVGHELRTPLTGIIGYANMLLRRRVTPEQSRLWHGQILEAAKRELRIVEMLEFFAAAGGGRTALRPETVAMAPLVNSVVSTRAAGLDDRYQLSLEIADGDAAALADRHWLSVALDELLDNAIKFSPEGGPIVVAVATGPSPTDASGRYVTVTVRDRGLGIPQSAQETIFDEFVQLDESDTRAFGGLGLGLTLVRRVVDTYEGFLTCTSDLGQGTSVTIGLPAVGMATRRGRRERLRVRN